MSDEQTGPFYVHWLNPSPSRNAEYGRGGAGPRAVQDLPEAIRFIMEDLSEQSRGTAWINASAGPSLTIQEIESRYRAIPKPSPE